MKARGLTCESRLVRLSERGIHLLPPHRQNHSRDARHQPRRDAYDRLGPEIHFLAQQGILNGPKRTDGYYTHHDVEIENGIAIELGQILALDKGSPKTAVDECGGQPHENGQHANQPELVGHEQSSQDDPHDKGQSLPGKPLDGALS